MRLTQRRSAPRRSGIPCPLGPDPERRAVATWMLREFQGCCDPIARDAGGPYEIRPGCCEDDDDDDDHTEDNDNDGDDDHHSYCSCYYFKSVGVGVVVVGGGGGCCCCCI